MQLFYDPTLEPGSTECIFSREESSHLIRVLRKKVGDIVHITNGRGYLFSGEISDPSLNQCRVTITEQEKTVPRMYELHLVVAPTKSIDRYEWFLEKATEIGIDDITPIICDHSERKIIKKPRVRDRGTVGIPDLSFAFGKKSCDSKRHCDPMVTKRFDTTAR